jgi:hypothetical protein
MSAGSPLFTKVAGPNRLRLYEGVVDTTPLFPDGVLAERADGRAVGLEIRNRLEALSADAVLLIDLRTLQRADFFALRELLMALEMTCGKGQSSRYRVFAVDYSRAELLETIEMIARDRGIVLPLINASGEWRPIGKLTGTERNTLAAVVATEMITAAELATQCGIPISAASNRLRRLHALCLIRREERSISRGGREFLYCSLLPPPGVQWPSE